MPFGPALPALQKPGLGSSLDLNLRLNRGLLFLYLLNEGSGSRVNNLVDPKVAPGTLQAGATWRGPGVDISGSGYIRASVVDTGYLGALTVIWRGVVRSAGGYRHFFSKHPSGGGVTNPLEFRTDGGGVALQAVRAAGSYNTWTGPSLTTGKLQTLAVTFPDGLMSSSATFYIDGVPTVVTSAFAATQVTGTNNDITIGRREDGAVQMDGVISSVAAWSRALSAWEIRLLSMSPWYQIGSRLPQPIRPSRTFMPGSPPDGETLSRARITQEVVLALVSPTSQKARLTQETVLALVAPTDANLRVTQIVVEVLQDVNIGATAGSGNQVILIF